MGLQKMVLIASLMNASGTADCNSFKLDLFRILSERQNRVFAIVLQHECSLEISFSNFLENEILLENSSCKIVSKTKFWRSEKNRNTSNLHFPDYISVILCILLAVKMFNNKDDNAAGGGANLENISTQASTFKFCISIVFRYFVFISKYWIWNYNLFFNNV